MKQACTSTSVTCTSTVDGDASSSLSHVPSVPGSSSVEVDAGEAINEESVGGEENASIVPIVEEESSQPVVEMAGPKFLTSTPKATSGKCKKCPQKSRRIKKLKRINTRLNKRLQNWKIKYRQLKNEKV